MDLGLGYSSMNWLREPLIIVFCFFQNSAGREHSGKILKKHR